MKAFSAALDDIIQTRGHWGIRHDNLRDATRLYITENVVFAHRTYLKSFGRLLEGHFSSSTRYVKYTPEMVEQMLNGLLHEAPQLELRLKSATGDAARKSAFLLLLTCITVDALFQCNLLRSIGVSIDKIS